MPNLKVEFDDGTSLMLEPYDNDQRWRLIDQSGYGLDMEHYVYFCLDDPLPGQKLWLIIWVKDSSGGASRRSRSPSHESASPVRRVEQMAV